MAFFEACSLISSNLPLVLPHALLALGDLSRAAAGGSRARFGDMERALEMSLDVRRRQLEINCLMDDFEPLELATVFGVFWVLDSPSVPPERGFPLDLQ